MIKKNYFTLLSLLIPLCLSNINHSFCEISRKKLGSNSLSLYVEEAHGARNI